jgi:hypothetical protein
MKSISQGSAHSSHSALVIKTRQVEQLRLFYHTIGIDMAEEQHQKGPLHYAGLAAQTDDRVLDDDDGLEASGIHTGRAIYR